eukprot:TRINITY_DN2655_c0_g3_i2.p2 TRINITY_DN2655_c0_g3~~TRINITY_DN2655_c0_g3_i2.p2  ORF type:complete len:105 (+),score=4.26 TRINITY_DN2655_c0_g3_i2:468-782(+)
MCVQKLFHLQEKQQDRKERIFFQVQQRSESKVRKQYTYSRFMVFLILILNIWQQVVFIIFKIGLLTQLQKHLALSGQIFEDGVIVWSVQVQKKGREHATLIFQC